MAGQKLSDAQSKKLALVVKVFSGKDEKANKNLERFADKYLRWKLGVRGTGPHSHGYTKAQRDEITGAINAAFGIKAPERKARKAAAPAKAKAPAKGKAAGKAAGKAPARKGKAGKPGTGAKKSAAQLAAEQTARAEGRPEAFKA